MQARWETVTESQFNHERAGLSALRDALPDAHPWRAWSNFTFTASQGAPREVDVLLIAPNGLHLIELKDWKGRLQGAGSTWVQEFGDGRPPRSHRNPLHLANQKAKELRSLIQASMPRGAEVPWVTASVLFTHPGLTIELPVNDQAGLFFLGTRGRSALPDIMTRLTEAPRSERDRIDMTRSNMLQGVISSKIGIRRSDAEYHVGPWKLDRQAVDSGPTWSDHIGRHTSIPDLRRIRIYYRERNADRALSESIDRAARREAQVLRGITHPGIVPVVDFDPSGHSAGPSLLYPWNPLTLRLDEYLLAHGAKLDLKTRVELIRQLAETVAYAHRRRLYHRTLSAHAIHVVPGPRRADVDQDGAAGLDAAWLRPRLMIADWQVAVRRNGGAQMTSIAVSTQVDQHLDIESAAYGAPELTAAHPDPVSMDVFGLGTLGYLLLTGRAPAASRTELTTKLEAEPEGLRPSSVADGLSQDADDLIGWATAFDPQRRLATVEEFIELLGTLEQEFKDETADEPAVEESESTPQVDALEAKAGDVLAGRWEIKRRLGAGATSIAFLARDLEVPDPEPKQQDRREVVLKVSRSDDRASLLRREAEVLRRLGGDSRIVRLRIDEPVLLGNPPRTTLVLDYAGRETVARQLRAEGRLTVDQLDKYAEYLFGAIDHLDGQGVWHRDLKPDNIAILERPNRSKQLVLFDFSLADHSIEDIEAGTPGYLDPFLGTPKRPRYDAAAEYYALAVTLHEMASRALPIWGDDKVAARQTDPAKEPYPRLAVDVFDPAIKDGLDQFFRRALHRDADERFKTLSEMRDAWKLVFLRTDDRKPVGTRHSRHGSAAKRQDADGAGIGLTDPPDIRKIRDKAAAEATLGTPLDAAGLSPRAVSVVHDLNVATVGELLDLSRRALINQPGLGSNTRREIQQRIKQWRQAFHDEAASPLSPTGREAADSELERELGDALARAGAEAPVEALRRLRLDTLTTLLIPDAGTRRDSRNAVDATRLWLGFPDANNEIPGFDRIPPTQGAVGARLGLTSGRVGQVIAKQRERWTEIPALVALRDEAVEVVEGLGRVATLDELAVALLSRRGSNMSSDAARLAYARGVALAAVDLAENGMDEALLTTRRHRDGRPLLIAMEVREDVDGPTTPQSIALLDLADALSTAADDLAARESLPSSATTLTELGEVLAKQLSSFPDLDERRLVHLAAAASRTAGASSRLEIYPKSLPLVRALRITQAGLLGSLPGLTELQQPFLGVSDIQERVLSRFPDLIDKIGRPQLDSQLIEAGFELKWIRDDQQREHGYVARILDFGTTSVSLGSRQSTVWGSRRTRQTDPKIALADRIDERLNASLGRPGFRILTVGTSAYPRARRELAQRFAVQAVPVAGLFVAKLKERIELGTKPTWDTILNADVAESGSRASTKLREYTSAAWRDLEPELAALLASPQRSKDSPVLLYDAGLLTRYGALSVLHRLAEAARRGGGRPLWLLAPSTDPEAGPQLDGATVQTPMDNEWVVLTREWVENLHRSGADSKSGGEDVRA